MMDRSAFPIYSVQFLWFNHEYFWIRIEGHKELPDVDYLAERFFKRHQFIAEPEGRSNVFFAFYAQHFSHQFFRKDHSKGPGFTMGKDGVIPFNGFLLRNIYVNENDTTMYLVYKLKYYSSHSNLDEFSR